ncbi:MoxR protein [Pseudomonas fluorescens]|nr:MoxR protein [Pseudomonas fluorescens]ROO06471.1 MoxR protein [Pseudomonas fluorescens]ROO15801.1 MoxR protein [Pseudomonas fluorescens]
MNDEGLVYVSLAQLMALEFNARDLSFLARQPQGSILAGNHASRLRGRGLNFDELRRYQPGDDLRHLDWRASLRTGKPVVRTFTEERDRPALIVVDQRMSMFFGSQRSFKSAVAAELAALAAWMVFHAGDRVGGLVFNDQRIDSIAPLRSRKRVEALLSRVVQQNRALNAGNPDAEDEDQLDKALQRCLGVAGHDHLICIVSDFAGAGERTLQLMRQLSAHNDVIALQVYDPLALKLPNNGRLLVTQGELQVELAIEKRNVHQPLGDFLSGRLKDVATLLRRSQVPLMMISTAEDAHGQLRAELGKSAGGAR